MNSGHQVPLRLPKDPTLARIVTELDWSANGEWSLALRPADCAHLLAELRKPPSKRRTNRKDT